MRIVLIILLLVLGGCSVGVRTPLVDARIETGSRFLGINSGVRVVFPYQGTGFTDPLSERYGVAWENIQGNYPQYKFN